MDKVYSKISTNIEGLDRLLYGGLDMKGGVHTIFIRGGRTLNVPFSECRCYMA